VKGGNSDGAVKKKMDVRDARREGTKYDSWSKLGDTVNVSRFLGGNHSGNR